MFSLEGSTGVWGSTDIRAGGYSTDDHLEQICGTYRMLLARVGERPPDAHLGRGELFRIRNQTRRTWVKTGSVQYPCRCGPRNWTGGCIQKYQI